MNKPTNKHDGSQYVLESVGRVPPPPGVQFPARDIALARSLARCVAYTL